MPVDVRQTAYPTLNPDRIPESTKYEIARATFRAVCRYFEQPGVQEEFEKWRAERDRRLKAAQKGE